MDQRKQELLERTIASWQANPRLIFFIIRIGIFWFLEGPHFLAAPLLFRPYAYSMAWPRLHYTSSNAET